MDSFRGYSKFYNHDNKDTVDRMRKAGVDEPDIIWVGNEKVHGSNFSFWTDGTEVKTAKRTGFLDKNSNFFNCSIIVDKYKQNILDLYQRSGSVGVVTVYGELFGGNYNNPNISNKNVKVVQRDMSYHPDIEFIVFDVRMDEEYIQDYDTLRLLVIESGLKFVPEVVRGSWDEVKDYDVENGHSTVYQLYDELKDYPPVRTKKWEGLVLRPIHKHFLVKLKTKTHLENKKVSRVKLNVDEEKSLCSQFVENNINEARVESAISKTGRDVPLPRIINEVLNDALADFDPYVVRVKNMDKSQQKQVYGVYSRYSRNTIYKLVNEVLTLENQTSNPQSTDE